MTTTAVTDVVAALDVRYPREHAEEWDRVGLVLGEFDAPVERILCVVDCVPETVDEAIAAGAQMIVAHHPLLLKPVSSIAPDTFKGRIIHRLIRAGVALHVAHTNADIASPGVSDALAARLDLVDTRPLVPRRTDERLGLDLVDTRPLVPRRTDERLGHDLVDTRPPVPRRTDEKLGLGRVGRLTNPMTLADFTAFVASRLPVTAAGVRAAGDPERLIGTLAVCGGAGDSLLGVATRAGVDAYLCADLRHHPAGEHLAGGGPALIDVAHWASERPWLDELAEWLRERFPIEVLVSDVDTDPWTVHAESPKKESRS